MDIKIEKVNVTSRGKNKLSTDVKLIKPLDLPPEEYIEYMREVFEEAKELVCYGHMSIDMDGSINQIGWDVEEELTKILIKEIEKN